MFGQEKRAAEIINKIKSQVGLISKKLEFIPENKRKKVVRIMGPGFVPGRDSFQIDVIKKAGGIPFVPEKSGEIYKISLKEWQNFNPDFIYVCGNDKNYLKGFFKKPGWNEVNAVKNFLKRDRFIVCVSPKNPTTDISLIFRQIL
jgi:ABC-type Fe3+-hydroxamate transport system substrate-binding protein